MPNSKQTANIIEIFSSIQGEGPYVGYEQLFIRFSLCNLNCRYCDTPFQLQKHCLVQDPKNKNSFAKILNPINAKMLLDIVKMYKNIHSISLTGGEPLIQTDFLQEFLPLLDQKIYLETNGTLGNRLAKIIDYVDIIAMDIKINSSTQLGDHWAEHEQMIDLALEKGKEIFAKVVATSQITRDEVDNIINLLENRPIELIIQPVTTKDENLKLTNDKIFELMKAFSPVIKTRVIPQVHTFLGIM